VPADRRDVAGFSRLYRKGPGQPAKLCFMGHALIENRHGLVVAGAAGAAGGTAERNAALAIESRRAPPGRNGSPWAPARGEPVLGLARSQTRGMPRTLSTNSGRWR